MAQIPLRARDGSVRAYVIVDDEDLDTLNQWRWSLQAGRYAGRKYRKDGKTFAVYMHRAIAGLEYGDRREVDHISGNCLDNRRANLRIVEHRENSQNLSPAGYRTGSSSYRGVCWEARRQKWSATVTLDGRGHFVGYFDDELEAARAARDWREAHMSHSAREAA